MPSIFTRTAPRLSLVALFLGLAPTALVPTHAAQAQGLFANTVVHAEILPGWRTADGSRMAALHLQLEPGWHTYWRIPGDAGIAPRFDWSQSQNIAAIEPIWPRPMVFRQNGMQSYGYENELILPLRVTPRNPSRPMAIIGELAIGACRDTCMPVDLSVRGALRGQGAEDRRISASLEARAQTGLPHARTTCRLEPQTRGAELTLRMTVPQVARDEDVVMELPGSGYWISNSRTWREGGELVAQARIRDPEHGPVGINRSMVRYTILTDDRMVAAQGCVGG